MKHYVYRIDDPITGEFYIGSRSCECDIGDDLYMGSYTTWKPIDKSRLIKTILKSNFRKRETCIKYESNLIHEKINEDLNRNYHIPTVGFFAGFTGKRHTADTLISMSEIKQGNKNPFFGKQHTIKWKLYMSNVQKQIGNKPPDRCGVRLSTETKRKMSNTRCDLFNSDLGDVVRKNISDGNSKEILQFDKDGTFIKKWKSLSNASIKLNISVSNISSCSNGKLKTAGGFIWK